MLGVQVLLVAALCFVAGLEMGSPGTVLAILKACAMVYVTLKTNTAPELCAAMAAAGHLSTACP